MKSNLDFYMVSMPVRAIDRPSLSLPTLVSNLRKNNYLVEQRDYNMEFQDALITENYLSVIYFDILPIILKTNSINSEKTQSLRDFYKQLESIYKNYGFCRIEKVKEDMQRRNYDFLQATDGVNISNLIFSISGFLRTYFRTVIYYADFFQKNGISEYVREKINNVIEDIVDSNTLVVGVSIMEVQRAFSLWFTHQLRKKYSGYIVVGGSDVMLNKEKYVEYNDFIDFAVWVDGEFTLSALVDHLKTQGKDFSAIPGLIYRDKEKVIQNELLENYCDEWDEADYEGFPLNLYLTSAMQLLTSKGCLWSKCKFCMHWNSYGMEFRQKSIKTAIDEMEHLYEKYGTDLFIFVDEAFPPQYNLAMSQEIINRGLNIRWMQMTRVEDGYSNEIFKEMYDSGCRIIEWGQESGSQHVLDDMGKGVNMESAQRIYHESATNGIINKTLMFHNYPTENIEDLARSIHLIEKNTKKRFVKPMLTLRHAFVLKLGSPLAEIALGEGDNEYFLKAWKAESTYNLNLKYISRKNELNDIKSMMIERYLKDMRNYLQSRRVFITGNDNIAMDLVLVKEKEKGKKLAADVFQPEGF